MICECACACVCACVLILVCACLCACVRVVCACAHPLVCICTILCTFICLCSDLLRLTKRGYIVCLPWKLFQFCLVAALGQGATRPLLFRNYELPSADLAKAYAHKKTIDCTLTEVYGLIFFIITSLSRKHMHTRKPLAAISQNYMDVFCF